MRGRASPLSLARDSGPPRTTHSHSTPHLGVQDKGPPPPSDGPPTRRRASYGVRNVNVKRISCGFKVDSGRIRPQIFPRPVDNSIPVASGRASVAAPPGERGGSVRRVPGRGPDPSRWAALDDGQHDRLSRRCGDGGRGQRRAGQPRRPGRVQSSEGLRRLDTGGGGHGQGRALRHPAALGGGARCPAGHGPVGAARPCRGERQPGSRPGPAHAGRPAPRRGPAADPHRPRRSLRPGRAPGRDGRSRPTGAAGRLASQPG